MTRALDRLADALERAVDLLGRAVSWLTLALVLLMAANVLLRYLFRIGAVWAGELEWHLLAPLALLGMSYAILRDGHLRVDILYVRLGATTRLAVDFAAALLLTAMAVATLLLSLGYVEQSYVIRETSGDPGGLPYRYALKAIIPAGFAALALLGVAQSLRLGLRLLRRPPA